MEEGTRGSLILNLILTNREDVPEEIGIAVTLEESSHVIPIFLIFFKKNTKIE